MHLNHPQIEYCLKPGVIEEYYNANKDFEELFDSISSPIAWIGTMGV